MTAPLHVVHVVDALALGGAERMLVELANRTVADGYRVSVCVTRSVVTMAPRLDSRIELIVLGRRRRFEVEPLMRFARWCSSHDVDIVHCHGRSSFSLIALLAATRRLQSPVLLHDHHNLVAHPEVPLWFRVAKRYLAAYVGVYPQQRDWARRAGVASERTLVITNALDLSAVARGEVQGAPLSRRAGHCQLVFVGGLRHDKAVDVLLEAFARVRTPAMLHIIGGDADATYARTCRELAGKLGVADRVTFEGQRDDALALAKTADLAVHSSRSESGPLVLAEYAAIGLPFVSTRVGGVAATLERAGAGTFVDAEDAGALAGAIDEMLALPDEERRRRGRAASESARQMLDISVAMPAWYTLYAQIARPR